MDHLREDLPSEGSMADALLSAILGPTYRATRLAGWIAENRAELEQGVTSFLELWASPKGAAVGTQEMRTALGVVAMQETIMERPEMLESILITYALLAERVAALDPEVREAARLRSLSKASATPEEARRG